MIDKRSTGLYAKFTVTRTDGKSAPGEKHDGCDYFVLDLTHDPHALAAAVAYADDCEREYPVLARDLRRRLYPYVPKPHPNNKPAAPVSSDARPARTLKDYRPQHDEGCNALSCRWCGSMNQHPRYDSHVFEPNTGGDCTCGLDALLAVSHG